MTLAMWQIALTDAENASTMYPDGAMNKKAPQL
jgi:hypothetical protein